MTISQNGTLDERYLNWLYRQIGSETNPNPARSFWLLSVQMYQTEFTWTVPNDDNRVWDGRDLREEFLAEEEDIRNALWLSEECSMLEMLVALGRRVSFESQGEPYDWYWEMITNLGLYSCNDDSYDDSMSEHVDSVLQVLIERNYGKGGKGGLFPLRKPDKDQTKVEIWHQMSSYLLEKRYN